MTPDSRDSGRSSGPRKPGKVTFRVPPDLLDEVDELAEAEFDGNRSDVARGALEAFIENATDTPATTGPRTLRMDGGHQPADSLTEAIDALEAVQWRKIPGVSCVTAATFTQVLDEARDELREDGKIVEVNQFPTEGNGVSFDGP